MRQYFYNQETFEYTYFQDYPEDRAHWRYLTPKEFVEHKIKLGLF